MSIKKSMNQRLSFTLLSPEELPCLDLLEDAESHVYHYFADFDGSASEIVLLIANGQNAEVRLIDAKGYPKRKARIYKQFAVSIEDYLNLFNSLVQLGVLDVNSHHRLTSQESMMYLSIKDQGKMPHAFEVISNWSSERQLPKRSDDQYLVFSEAIYRWISEMTPRTGRRRR